MILIPELDLPTRYPRYKDQTPPSATPRLGAEARAHVERYLQWDLSVAP